MSSYHKIRTIYGKELIDILRDRRTLIAMIVVPIVLYPLLMLGSIQAVSFQTEELEVEEVVIGFVSEPQGERFGRMIDSDTREINRTLFALDPESEEALALPKPLANASLRAYPSRDAIEQEIRQRRVQVGVIYESDQLIAVPDLAAQINVEILADMEEIRSSTAHRRVKDLLNRVNERMRNQRLAGLGLPPATIEPFPIEIVDLSAPPSILGQILPLVLILMTITGAIYPAIDLTAGERERGTLESLMVCPIPTVDLIVGKFLVVTTVAIMGAALNLGSVAATVYFGGFDKILASSGGGIPIIKMLVILLCLIPFAILMSAVMLAVCSYARTFKEAQNYVTPVILAVLIPGGIAALPATRLEGIMLVMPVGNMVLLSRDFLLGASVPFSSIATVLLATTLYAAAAVAIAANIFGHESVVFSDAASWKGLFDRRKIKSRSVPKLATGVMVVALLFPVWFFVQSSLSPGPDENAGDLLYATGWLMPTLFVLFPLAGLLFARINPVKTYMLRLPSIRYIVAGLLVGLSAWVPSHEISALQHSLIKFPRAMLESNARMAETLVELPLFSVLVLIAVVPSLCEELLFRGFLLSSLRTATRKWPAILISSAIFAIFHFFIFKFAVTAALGVVMAYLCWQSRSIFPAIFAHLLHNSLGVISVAIPEVYEKIGIVTDEQVRHLPAPVLIGGCVVFIAGLALCLKTEETPPEVDAVSTPTNREMASV